MRILLAFMFLGMVNVAIAHGHHDDDDRDECKVCPPVVTCPPDNSNTILRKACKLVISPRLRHLGNGHLVIRCRSLEVIKD